MKNSKFLLIPLGLLCTLTATAEENPSRFTLKGFGSLVGTGTDKNSVGFRRDISRATGTREAWDITNDSRFGVQVDAKLTDTLQATVQWVGRDRVGDFLEQNLEWAFLKWSIKSDLDLRVGRLGADVFMLSDYRNVDYAYPWIRPPHEFYGNLPYYHFDGADIVKNFDVDGGLLSIKAFGGYSSAAIPISNDSFDQRTVSFGSSIKFEKNDWRFSAGYAHLEILSELSFDKISPPNFLINEFMNAGNLDLLNFLWPGVKGAVSNLFVKGKSVDYFSLGAAYDDGTWLAQSEVSYINTNTIWYPDQVSGYLSVGRRFSSVTLYSLLGIAENLNPYVSVPKPPRGVSELDTAYTVLNDASNSSGFSEKSVSLGLRWDFHTNMAFKAQWSHYWLGSDFNRAWVYHSDVTPRQDQINVFSVGVDFVF